MRRPVERRKDSELPLGYIAEKVRRMRRIQMSVKAEARKGRLKWLSSLKEK